MIQGGVRRIRTGQHSSGPRQQQLWSRVEKVVHGTDRIRNEWTVLVVSRRVRAGEGLAVHAVALLDETGERTPSGAQ